MSGQIEAVRKELATRIASTALPQIKPSLPAIKVWPLINNKSFWLEIRKATEKKMCLSFVGKEKWR